MGFGSGEFDEPELNRRELFLAIAVAAMGTVADPVGLSEGELKAAIAPWLPDLGASAFAFKVGGRPAMFWPENWGADLRPIGSITKTFTSVIVLKLAELKKLSLDDKLSRFGLKIPGDGAVSIRQMLSHTSGLPEYFYGVDPSTESSREKILSMIRVAAATSTLPQGKFYYSNTNFYLLGEICASVTRTPLGQLFRRYIYEPLRIGGILERLPTFDCRWYGGAGELAMSVKDLATFGEAVSRLDPRLLAPQSWKSIATPQTPMDGESGNGYGFGTIVADLSIYPTLSHGGTIPANHNVGPFASMLISRREGLQSMGFACFGEKEWAGPNTNASYGAFASLCATADLKWWIAEARKYPAHFSEWIKKGLITGPAAAALSNHKAASRLGLFRSFEVKGEVVRPQEVTLDGWAKGSKSNALLSARFGPKGELLEFVWN